VLPLVRGLRNVGRCRSGTRARHQLKNYEGKDGEDGQASQEEILRSITKDPAYWVEESEEDRDKTQT
jgi:hypothetical protein